MPKTLEDECREQCAGAAEFFGQVFTEMDDGRPIDIPGEISRLRRIASQAAKEVVSCNEKIIKLQAMCPHNWEFSRQVNNCHEHNWNVTYKCTVCDAERTEMDRPPVCETCCCDLERAKKDDPAAQTKLQGLERGTHWNPPVAFVCPQCRKVHILYHEGD